MNNVSVQTDPVVASSNLIMLPPLVNALLGNDMDCYKSLSLRVSVLEEELYQKKQDIIALTGFNEMLKKERQLLSQNVIKVSQKLYSTYQEIASTGAEIAKAKAEIEKLKSENVMLLNKLNEHYYKSRKASQCSIVTSTSSPLP